MNHLQQSEEADKRGLELGREQGKALENTLRHMIEDVADTGAEKQVGDYLVGYAIEEAEGMYESHDGRLEWTEPGENNVHVEVSVRDAADGRFIPGLAPEVMLIDQEGNRFGPYRHQLLWHPYLYHYGRNWYLPKAGTYSLLVRFDAPVFPRHDKVNGLRFENGGECEFDRVEIEIGDA